MADREIVASRTERLLALILLELKGSASQQDKIVALNRVGFANPDIAQMLGTTAAVVGQSVYTAKRAPKRRAKKARAKMMS